MVKSFVDAFRLNTHIVEFNGKEYQFLIEDYSLSLSASSLETTGSRLSSSTVGSD